MKSFYITISDLKFALACNALLMIASGSALARGDDLPVPILNDHASNELPALGMVQSTKRWAIQLGAGSASVLEAQAIKLREQWSDARVVMVSGQAKLVVGDWLSASEAAVSLKALRLVNAQAFVRQLPSDRQSTPSSLPLSHQTKEKMIKEPAMLAPPITSRSVEPMVAVPAEEAQSNPAPSLPIAVEAVKDDDVLPAIVAVALASQPEFTPETPELQAAVELLEQEISNLDDVIAAAVPESVKPEAAPAVDLTLTDLPEKRGIALPMRAKEPIRFKAAQPLVEPVNLMLSPLYLLPTDSSAQVQHPQALTMKTVLEALVRPNLSVSRSEAQSTSTAKPDPVLARKVKLFARMAELANAGLWEMALPLVKEAKLKEMHLSSVDHLLLGWIWLQNKEPRVAKGYFQTALLQSPQDEARYALGLCYLLLGDKSAAQGVIREMSAGKQKDHLRSLLLH